MKRDLTELVKYNLGLRNPQLIGLDHVDCYDSSGKSRLMYQIHLEKAPKKANSLSYE